MHRRNQIKPTRTLVSAQAGFTLLELLTALALLGLIMVLAVGGIRFGERAWERSGKAASQDEQLLSAVSVLKRELEQAYPAYASPDRTTYEVDFDGDAERVSFLAPLPAGILDGVMARQDLHLEEHKGAKQLILHWKVDLPLFKKTSSTEGSMVLFDGVDGFSVSYFGTERQDMPPSWSSTWHQRRSLPQLIKLTVAILGKKNAIETIVSPRITVNVECIFDTVGRSCRRS